MRDVYQTAGQLVTVYDKHDNPRCNIKVTDVFETTFGAPDMRLVKGEGNGDRIEEFQEDHRMAWAELIKSGELELNEDTVLITELFVPRSWEKGESEWRKELKPKRMLKCKKQLSLIRHKRKR